MEVPSAKTILRDVSRVKIKKARMSEDLGQSLQAVVPSPFPLIEEGLLTPSPGQISALNGNGLGLRGLSMENRIVKLQEQVETLTGVLAAKRKWFFDTLRSLVHIFGRDFQIPSIRECSPRCRSRKPSTSISKN